MNDDPSQRRAKFDQLFRENPDPWEFETSTYERDKRDATMAAIAGRRFAHVLEIGCATGVLTERLAEVCDSLLAVDVSEVALTAARQRLADRNHVKLTRAEIPAQWPAGRYDLILLSEVLYFLAEEEITETSRRFLDALEPEGWVLLVNWTGANDLPVSGPRAAELFCAGGWRRTGRIVRPGYRLDLLARPRVSQVPRCR